ncbi:MAG: thiamine phosphate synthase [Mariprofundaceae bacterium]
MTKLQGIYGVLPSGLSTDDLLEKAKAALSGGIKTLQFRDKKSGYKRALERAKLLRQLTSEFDVTLIINDSVQMAQDAQADGVHLGRDDVLNLTELRVEVGQDFLIGITCRVDAAFAKHALSSGADYVSFGAVFPTSTKPEVPEIGLPRLAKARQLFPDANICAIGGITLENLAEVKTCNPDCVAVISGLFATDDIEATARQMVQIWERH